MPQDAHARFDATYRAYDYYIHFDKTLFWPSSAFLPMETKFRDVMQQAVTLLPQYTDFRMFCKSGASSKQLFAIYTAEIIAAPRAVRFTYYAFSN